MQSFSARKRRKTFLRSYTSPSLVRNNNYSVDLACSAEQESSSVSVDRLPVPNGQFDKTPYPINLERNKSHRTKLSKLKVLLSPRNPYEEFHRLFTDIPKEEFPINDYSCALSRDILLHGRLFFSQNWLCFYSNIFGFETVVKLEFKKVKSITRARTAYMFPNAILVRTEKKYLFCSFLMRDAAHKLLSAAWQESTNNRPDSGVDEVSANGEQDEDESENLEEITEETRMPIETQALQPSKDTALWSLSQHQRTVSCPNTPLSRHPSVDEKPEISTVYLHHKDHHTHKRSSYINSMKKYSVKIAGASCSLLKSTYNWLSSLDWLCKRNKFSPAEVFFLVSTCFLILLLISTYALMDRISKLEDRFQHTLPGSTSDQYLTTDLQQSDENWSRLMKDHETRYRQKTERFNKALKDLLLSVDNVQSKLKLIKDELGEPTDIH